MKPFIIILSFAGILFASCKKHHSDPEPIGFCGTIVSEASRADYFIFGYFGQMGCNYYEVKNSTLYAGTSCQTDSAGFTNTLSQHKYNLSQALTYNLPVALSNLPDTTLGCPNCADQGGWYIEYRIAGKVKKYNLDNDTAALPATIKYYVLMMKNTVDSLK